MKCRIMHNATFHQGIDCSLQDNNVSPGTDMHHNLKISTCAPLNIKMTVPYLFYAGKSFTILQSLNALAYLACLVDTFYVH